MRFIRSKNKNNEMVEPYPVEAPAAPTAPPGRSLLAYFLPVGAAAALVLLLITLYSVLWSGSVTDDAVRAAVRSSAHALASRASGLVASREELLGLVSNFTSVHKALQDQDKQALADAAAAAEHLLPGALQLRLFTPGPLSPDPTGKAPLGFAGVDMVRRALQGGEVAAEIHQIDTGHPYLAMARPVKAQGQVIGAAFAAWPVDGLKQIVSAARINEGELWLVQGGSKGFVIAGTGAGAPSADMPSQAVDGTIWQIYFAPLEAGLGQGSALLWVLLILGVAAVLAVAYLQQRSLARGLKSDMATLVGLGEAIVHGGGSEHPGVMVASNRDAILLMADLAHRSPGLGGQAGAAQARGDGAPAPGRKASPKPPPKHRFSESTGIEVEESHQRPPINAAATIFRAYDIRGVVGSELTSEVATSLGWAFADTALEQGVATVYVAHDPRVSSPKLYDALCTGLAEIGMRVVELDMAPAALLYFAMHKDPDAAAVLVTGSHNPPEYNGFKLYLRTEPVQGGQLQELHARMSRGGFEPAPGSREHSDLRQEYLDAVVQEISLTRPLKVVVDGGNGAAGELACEALEALGCEVVPLYCEPDGSFPHHHPDPSREENLLDLRREVMAQGADLGIAFDGDGDRIGGVDDRGEPVRPEHVLMLLAADILRRHPGSDVVYDVKSSRHLASFVLAQGGRPIMWCSGHTRMKEKMRETGALLGGEFAGHFYIKERWYGSDDAIYVAARLLEVIADDPRPVHEQMAELPSSPATPEYQLALAEGESAALMQAIEARVEFSDARVVDLDGLRVEFPQSWGLVRASNTLPSLTFRFEADSDAELEAVMQRFRELLAQVAPGKALPF